MFSRDLSDNRKDYWQNNPERKGRIRKIMKKQFKFQETRFSLNQNNHDRPRCTDKGRVGH